VCGRVDGIQRKVNVEFKDQKTSAVIHCKLPEWLHREIGNPVGPEFDLELCRLVDTNYNYKVGTTLDQTLDRNKGVEAFIEFVIKKPGN
jgi:hypothetical protein